jgi:hypothetical protein
VLALNRSEMKRTKHHQEFHKSPRLHSSRMMLQPKKAAMLRVSAVVLALLMLAAYQQSKPQGNSNDKPQGNTNYNDLVDKTGNISKPADYRDRYQALGTFFVRDPVGAEEMHYTYASPGAAEFYRKNGKFADGTVLVKEVLGTDHAQLTTGDGHWASGLKVWFVMIKDNKGRYPGNPLWGDGWGWALYESDAPDKQIATDYKKDCLGCHIPAQKTDWVYVRGYPVLASK